MKNIINSLKELLNPPESKTVLVIDDSDVDRMFAVRTLARRYHVLSAAGAREGLEVAFKERPDLILLDYLMPEMNGVETLKEIREINGTIPVIMCTSFPDNRSITEAETLGVFAYIPKAGVFTDPNASLKTTIAMAEKKLNKDKM